MATSIETCINWCEPGWAYVSSNERIWITRIRRLAENDTDKCVIMKQPEDNGGFIYAKVPQRWVKISKPRQMNLTDEQRAEIVKRLQGTRTEAEYPRTIAPQGEKMPNSRF